LRLWDLDSTDSPLPEVPNQIPLSTVSIPILDTFVSIRIVPRKDRKRGVAFCHEMSFFGHSDGTCSPLVELNK
jgi:hypothetical protein